METQVNRLGSRTEPSTRSFSAGFTLVEILVVLTVITVIAAIVFPVFASSRARARAASCASNLRQLQGAFAMYANDNNNLLPPYNNMLQAGINVNGASVPAPDQSEQLVKSLSGYVKVPALWFCSADTYAGTAYTDLYINHKFTSYVYHEDILVHHSAPVPIDISGPNLGPDYLALLSDNPWGCKHNETESDTFPYSHGGRYNAVFLDGHIRTYAYDEQKCVDN